MWVLWFSVCFQIFFLRWVLKNVWQETCSDYYSSLIVGILQICNWWEQQSSKNGTTWSAISTAQKVAVANFMRLLFKSITNLLLAFNHLHEKDGHHLLPIFTCHPCFWCLCNFELSNGFQEECNTRDVYIPGVVQKCQVLNYEAAKKNPLSVGIPTHTHSYSLHVGPC
jgi:hypothetical protein